MVEIGYIYLNLNNPIVCWEAYRGIIISADQTIDLDHIHPSIWLSNKIRNENKAGLANELLIESIRMEVSPYKISRLRGLFVFPDINSAKKAESWGGHFKAENLVKVEIHTDKLKTKLDAKWITNLALDKNGLITQESISDLKKYWEGEIYDFNEDNFEYLIEGKAFILGKDHKEKAYAKIKEFMPETLATLELSRIAATLGSQLGHMIPYIIRTEHGKLKLVHLINFADASNETFLDKFQKYDGPKNTNDLNQFSEIVIPDLRKFDIEFMISEQELYGYKQLKIHI